MKKYKIKDYYVHIPKRVLAVMSNYRQVKSSMHEAGGIVLGQINGNNIYVMNLSLPNKFDKSGKYKFERNSDIARIIMQYEFINSNSKTIYIGEWHTHMEKTPTPSAIDINMIKNEFRNNTLNEPFLLLIIQGTKDLYVGLYDGANIYKYELVVELNY